MKKISTHFRPASVSNSINSEIEEGALNVSVINYGTGEKGEFPEYYPPEGEKPDAVTFLKLAFECLDVLQFDNFEDWLKAQPEFIGRRIMYKYYRKAGKWATELIRVLDLYGSVTPYDIDMSDEVETYLNENYDISTVITEE